MNDIDAIRAQLRADRYAAAKSAAGYLTDADFADRRRQPDVAGTAREAAAAKLGEVAAYTRALSLLGE